jgi:NADP-dependent 3-hydroxy acid dehydrogenase YdfG
MSGELAHLAAVITGAGSGIGRAITLALAASGASLWLVGRTLRKLEEVAEEAQQTSARTVCCETDLRCQTQLEALIHRLRRETGGVDVLVHSAGVFSMGPVESAGVEDLDNQYQINVRAPYVLTQALLPMLRARQGQVVFINSSAGLNASPNLGQYAATKFALKALADSLRAEVNADGIRVLSVYPGRTATPMQAAVHEMEGKAYCPETLAQPEAVASLVIGALTLPATSEITDLNIRPTRKP